METVIEVRDLVKDYRTGFWLNRKVRVLDGVSLQVGDNEIFGLLGPNGAGKTTTLKILIGLVRASAGQCRLFGQPVGQIEARRQVGFLPENPYYYMYLSGEEFLRFCGDLFGQPRAETRRRAGELLELVGLAREGAKPLMSYSKGMLQRIGIAQALINDPRLVFLDEPTSGLDPIGRREVRQIMERLKREGKTVLFNTHILPDVEEICDHAAIMVKGRIRLAGNIDALTTGGEGRGYVLEAQGIPAAAQEGLDRLGATEVLLEGEGRWEALFPDEERALAAAARVGEWGGEVCRVGVYRRPLEDVFMETVRQAEGEPR